MAGNRENSSPFSRGLFRQFIACLGLSKGRDSQVKPYPPSQANAEEQLEAREKYIITPGRGCTCNETISSRHRKTKNMQHTPCSTTGLSIGAEDTNREVRAPYTPIQHEGGSNVCAHLQDMRVTKVISIHYKECDLKTATLCIELDVNGWRRLYWQEYQDLIETPGAKITIERFRPSWRY
ncbi:hypothetical protein TSTA_051920 [Talaromyces stipitatus ATCC 10500]|uniref:Uncharacterized protein n=1 Tax=Talaromyces stipitatus (strain ATCC 10500 / CBS 375.48 / QM 6759 / NRRL 1006) TaxID=441959 RepID=B8MJQ6_TALSN|nr:uncharacterized protein TSTA_051920 [Talaromyces stipitatus ATCC 10500]EED15755.1 hypothetical protein TSTA_051920 [Talaromyces stipitatus ATCC 10500]